jgi:hypothetical protein
MDMQPFPHIHTALLPSDSLGVAGGNADTAIWLINRGDYDTAAIYVGVRYPCLLKT